MRYRKKVAAFVLRRQPTGQEALLVHAFATAPHLPWRVPGGGVDPGESPVEALYRELAEESGLEELALLRKLGVQRYFKPYIRAHVERHDFLLRAPASTPEVWSFRVAGAGADAGDLFTFRWVGPTLWRALDAEHRGVLNERYIPELFRVR